MNIKSLYPIIVVENMQEALKFYTEVMDFKVKHDAVRKDGGHVIVISNAAGLEMELMDKASDGPMKLEAGIHGFRMNVDDVNAAAEELKQNGVTIIAGPFETAMGYNLAIKDAQGVDITLIQHKK